MVFKGLTSFKFCFGIVKISSERTVMLAYLPASIGWGGTKVPLPPGGSVSNRATYGATVYENFLPALWGDAFLPMASKKKARQLFFKDGFDFSFDVCRYEFLADFRVKYIDAEKNFGIIPIKFPIVIRILNHLDKKFL